VSFLNHLYDWIVGSLLLAGFVSLSCTLPRVASWWKPLYYLALPLTFIPLVIILMVEFGIASGGVVQTLLRLTTFLLSLQLIAVPYIHRLEARNFKPEREN
jgi:hypothetical protein